METKTLEDFHKELKTRYFEMANNKYKWNGDIFDANDFPLDVVEAICNLGYARTFKPNKITSYEKIFNILNDVTQELETLDSENKPVGSYWEYVEKMLIKNANKGTGSSLINDFPNYIRELQLVPKFDKFDVDGGLLVLTNINNETVFTNKYKTERTDNNGQRPYPMCTVDKEALRVINSVDINNNFLYVSSFNGSGITKQMARALIEIMRTKPNGGRGIKAFDSFEATHFETFIRLLSKEKNGENIITYSTAFLILSAIYSNTGHNTIRYTFLQTLINLVINDENKYPIANRLLDTYFPNTKKHIKEIYIDDKTYRKDDMADSKKFDIGGIITSDIFAECKKFSRENETVAPLCKLYSKKETPEGDNYCLGMVQNYTTMFLRNDVFEEISKFIEMDTIIEPEAWVYKVVSRAYYSNGNSQRFATMKGEFRESIANGSRIIPFDSTQHSVIRFGNVYRPKFNIEVDDFK